MYYVTAPVLDMRERPDASSKVVSQALFAEEILCKEIKGEWAHIVTSDHYSGWVRCEGIIARKTPYVGDVEITRLKAHLYGVADTEYGPILSLPHGVKLQMQSHADPRWIKVSLPDGKEAFVQKGDVVSSDMEIVPFLNQFLGLPYTWGGRSSFGYDCSGFVQMIYRRFGVKLPRDAREQILVGEQVSIDALEFGDLVFWGHSEQEIKHVGMYMQNGKFIHTSSRENLPFLRYSNLSDKEWNGAGTYPFRSARRVIQQKPKEKLP